MLLCDLMLFLRCHYGVKSILFVSFGIYVAHLLSTLLLYNSNACRV